MLGTKPASSVWEVLFTLALGARTSMSDVKQAVISNRLLSRLSEADYALVAPHLELVDLARGDMIVRPNAQITHAIFPEEGIASIVARSPEGQAAEAGIIGREGFITPALVLGAEQIPVKIEAQIPGRAYRIPREEFAASVAASTTLRDALLRFAHVLNVQSTYTSLSNAIHHVEERLARWLLMCDDRCDSGEIRLTHDYLSVMLAVRRPTVTFSLHVLEGNKFIQSDRGNIFIRNRAALEDFAGDAYGIPEAEYRRLLGSM